MLKSPNQLGQTHNTLRASRGPKSPGHCRLTCVIAAFCSFAVAGVRVAGHTMQPAGVPHKQSIPFWQPGTKHHGFSEDSRSQHHVSHTLVHKRAFRRARRRAEQKGGTLYRGRWYTAHQLGTQHTQFQASQTESHSRAGQHGSLRPASRLKVVTWNSGGLQGYRYDEFRVWLEKSQAAADLDVICVQETHWKGSFEWTEQAWSAIHSGAGQPRTGGILILISPRVAARCQIKYDEIFPGRLLHVKLCADPSVDLLCVYQHTWGFHAGPNSAATAAGETALDILLSRRRAVWNKMRAWLHNVPARNLLVMLGDFNTPCCPDSGHVGMGVPRRASKRQPQDTAEFAQIVSDFDLCALNTWGKAGIHARTYIPYSLDASKPCGTQIDFVCTRRSQADPESKKAHTLPTFPLLSGAYFQHLPAQCVLKWPSKPKKSASAIEIQRARFAPTAIQVEHAFQQNTGLQAELQHAVRQELLVLGPGCPDQVNQALCKAWQRVAPHEEVRRPAKAWQDPRLQGRIAQMWQARRAALAPAAVAQSCILRKWQAWTRYQHLKTQLRKHSHDKRRELFDSLLSQAEAAVGKGMLTKVFQVVRRLMPKTSKRCIQLRGQQGQLMLPEAETQIMKEYFSVLYCSSEVPPASIELPQSVCFTQEEFCNALSHIQATKAVPPAYAPAKIWKLCSQELGQYYAHSIAGRLGPGRVTLPESWNRAHICLLPKPGKAIRSPGDLRPISLLDPMGKAFAGMIAGRVRHQVQDYLAQTPQFAYLARRSAYDALDRVFSHCAKIRSLVASQVRTVHDKRNGVQARDCVGGVQLSLDLTKAFDRLPRPTLHQALLRAGVPDDIAALIITMHHQVQLHIRHGGRSVTVNTGRGVRQGCKLAPMLWAAFTGLLFEDLQTKLDSTWVRNMCTAYADDFHAAWEIQSEADFVAARTSLQVFMSTLTNLGMEVNQRKSAVIIELRGRRSRKVLREHSVNLHDLGSCLHIEGKANNTLPIRKSHVYLGTVISYGAFETATLQHRCKAAWSAFGRLNRALRSKNALALRTRIRLWNACVFSAAKYGLGSSGLPVRGLATITGLAMRQIRIVARSPAHVTHETNEALLDRLGIQHPLQTLEREARQRIQLGRQNQSLLAIQPERVTAWWDLVLGTFQRPEQTDFPKHGNSAKLVEIGHLATAQQHPCPECGVYFACQASLRCHRTRRHGQSPQEEMATVRKRYPMEHAVDGMPTCRHCQKSFAGWPQFAQHIWRRTCHMQPQGQPNVSSSMTGGALPPARDPRIKQLLQQDGWRSLAADPSFQKQMLHHCPICLQWVASSPYIKAHLTRKHPEHAEALKATQQTCRQFGSEIRQPCSWCNTAYKCRPARHLVQCVVLFTSRLLAAILNSPTPAVGCASAGDHDECGPSDRGDAALQPLAAQPAGNGSGADRGNPQQMAQDRGAHQQRQGQAPGSRHGRDIRQWCRPQSATQRPTGQLSGSAVLHLVGASLRQERLQRSPLAQQIAGIVDRLCSA